MLHQRDATIGLILIVIVASSMATVGCVDIVDTETFNVEESGEASLQVEPGELTFEAGDTQQSLVLRNVDDRQGSLTVDDIVFRDDTDDGFEAGDDWPQQPLELQSGDSHEVTVYYSGDEPGQDRGVVEVYSGATAEPTATVDLMTQAPESPLQIEPDAVDFGDVPLNSEASEVVTVENTGDVSVAVDDIRLEGDGEYFESVQIHESGSTQELDDHPERIDGGDTVNFQIRYLPDQEGAHGIQWIVDTDDEKYSIAVSGQGVDEGCPVAEASIIFGDDSAAQTGVVEVDSTVELSASDSHAEDGGSISSYQWTVLESPGDHNMAYLSDPDVENADLTVYGVGDYTIELTVFDDQGLPSCETAILELEAVSESTIRVELSWEATDSDNDPASIDMDLHYLSSRGQWGDTPWNVYYGNMTPTEEWDDGSQVELKLDSLNTAFPEILVHNNPDPEYQYSAGVYYFGDSFDDGVADVQMRIFSDGELWLDESELLENAGAGMHTGGDFWHVADIDTQREEIDDVIFVDALYDDQGLAGAN